MTPQMFARRCICRQLDVKGTYAPGGNDAFAIGHDVVEEVLAVLGIQRGEATGATDNSGIFRELVDECDGGHHGASQLYMAERPCVRIVELI